MNSKILTILKLKEERDSGRHGTRGFTMVELLVAMAIMSVVLVAMYTVFSKLNRSYTTQNVAAEVQQSARIGTDFIAHDLRMAGLDPLRSAGARILAASAQSIQFSADRNKDGDLDAGEVITYSLIGDEVWVRDEIGPEILLDNVTDLRFTYFDDAVPPNNLADPVTQEVDDTNLDNIRTVVISMTVQEPAGLGGSVNRTYVTRVRCRNLGI
jgi:prepilin-type N-terminal cleavage/methylation domain-containing protein